MNPTENANAARRRRDLHRIGYSLALAALCVAVLGLRTHADFERIRVRVVTSPVLARDGSVEIPLPDLGRLGAGPAALVLRLRGGAEDARATIALGDTILAHTAVPAGDEVRVDVAAAVPPQAGHRLLVSGDRPGWQLTYLEAANVYGFSSGVLNFVIVPPARPPEPAVAGWVLIPIAIALFLLQPRTSWPARRATRVLHGGLITIVVALFAGVLAADTVAPYKVLLSPGTWALCVAVLYAEPLMRAWRPAHPHVVMFLRRLGVAARRLAPFTPYALVPLLFLWAVGQFYAPRVGFTRLIDFGAEFVAFEHPRLKAVPHALTPGAGYDGQFYAQLALDPLLRTEEIRSSIDAPGYRGRRILFSWVAYALGVGRPWLVLQAYALLNVISWMFLAWLLLRWLPPGDPRRAAAWVGCLLGEGLMVSVRKSLLDGPSMVLLALSVMAVEQKRRGTAATVLGMAALGRDTNALGALVLADGARARRGAASLALYAVMIVAPLALWLAYLSSLGLGPLEAGHANFGLPLAAYAGKWITTVTELRTDSWLLPARTSLLSLIALTTQAVVLVAARDWRSPWWRMGIAYVGLLTVLGYEVWKGYPGAAARVVMPMTFAFNVLIPRLRWFWPLWVLGNINLLDGLHVIGIRLFPE